VEKPQSTHGKRLRKGLLPSWHPGILAAWQPGIILPSLDLPTGLQTKRSKVAVDDGWGRRVVRVVRVVEWDSVGEAEACLREAFELGSGEATVPSTTYCSLLGYPTEVAPGPCLLALAG
jgi:hypothetical protein